MSACLVTVVSGQVYDRYAERLFASAVDCFPGDTLMLPGRSGWPDATLYRYHVLLEHDFAGYDHVYLCDADMRFEAPVGGEVFFGEIVATEHPGYVGKKLLPYEDRPESKAYVGRGDTYYAGGFVGGRREAFLNLAATIAAQIDADDERGIVARWHDESHLNAVLAKNPPIVTLSPSYCFPDDASGYPWLKGVPRVLVALDKTPEERHGR